VRAIRYQRPGFKPSTLLTSLTDHHYFSARELTALYHERWELEQRAFDFGAAQTLHQILDLGGESAPSRALGAGLLPARRQAQPGPIV
jgi:hypothetical protein